MIETMAKFSQLNINKHKGQVLDKIMSWKRQEALRAMEQTSLAQVKALAAVTEPARDFAAALTAEPGASLIAEIKRASPSRGVIAQDWSPPDIAEAYAANGAAAISCLTDARFFQGQLAYLTDIRERLHAEKLCTPLLRKDFIYHPYQIYEARVAGADAILLIVAVLGNAELKELSRLARQLGMAAVVEVHDEAELEIALAARASIIGVNNRDLKTFAVDINTTARLRQRIPAGTIVVGESGIRNRDDVKRMADMGCDAILVGESFCKLRQPERGAMVHEFVQAGKQ